MQKSTQMFYGIYLQNKFTEIEYFNFDKQKFLNFKRKKLKL